MIQPYRFMVKEVATLDHISDGRIILGIGPGWNRPEISNHGVNPTREVRVLKEKVQAVKEIWANDRAEFHGKYVDFGPIQSWPKPLQRPHPPLLLGGWGPTT